MPPLLADIDTYLDGIGLKHYRNINQFWSYMDSRYSRAQVSDLERAYIKLERGDEESFYAEIYHSLKTSLDFASLRHDLYRSYLNWLVDRLPESPEIIVDAGCGNGIVACFYSRHYPSSRVIGFDRSQEAIDCARELAQQLGCKNTDFVVADLNQPALPVARGCVDVITSVASLFARRRVQGNVPVYRLFEEQVDNQNQTALQSLLTYLRAENGILISFDKVPTIADQISWSALIQSAGLGLNLEKSAWVSYETIESDTVTLPALWAERKARPASRDDLISFFLSDRVQFDQLRLDFGKEALSELVFTFVNPKVFVAGARANYRDGSGTYWYEVWQAGPFLITFEHTDQGFRTLRLAPAMRLAEEKEALSIWMEQTSAYADVVEIFSAEISFST